MIEIYKCDAWIWVDDRNPKESPKSYAYVVETELKDGRHHRVEAEGEIVGTWNKVTLAAMAEALERFSMNAEVTVHSENGWVLNMMENYLMTWEGSDFYKSKTEKVANEEEWRRIAKASHALKLVPDRIGFDRSRDLYRKVFGEDRDDD